MIDLEAEAYKAEQARRCSKMFQAVLHVTLRDALSPHANDLDRRISQHLITARYGSLRRDFEEICALAMTSPEWVRDAYAAGRLTWESYKDAQKARER